MLLGSRPVGILLVLYYVPDYFLVIICKYTLLSVIYRPFDFISCDEPVNLNGNETQKSVKGHGCVSVGKQDSFKTQVSVCFVSVCAMTYYYKLAVHTDRLFSFQFGGNDYDTVEFTSVWCRVHTGIECYGPRQFLRKGFPCVK